MTSAMSTTLTMAGNAAPDHEPVFGYRSEAAVLADAERSFDVWWNSIPEVNRLFMDGFQMWSSWKAGWLSMAREVGQLRPLGSA